MRSHWAMETRAGGHAEQARRACVCMCVCVRDAICSQLLLTTGVSCPGQAGHPTPSCFGVFMGVSAALCKDGERAAKLSTCLVEATGLRSGQGLSCSFASVCSRGSTQARQGLVLWHLSFRSALASALWVSLGYAASFCRLLLFCDSPIPFFLMPHTTIWKAQWLPGQDDFRGSFQHTFIHDTL